MWLKLTIPVWNIARQIVSVLSLISGVQVIYQTPKIVAQLLFQKHNKLYVTIVVLRFVILSCRLIIQPQHQPSALHNEETAVQEAGPDTCLFAGLQRGDAQEAPSKYQAKGRSRKIEQPAGRWGQMPARSSADRESDGTMHRSLHRMRRVHRMNRMHRMHSRRRWLSRPGCPPRPRLSPLLPSFLLRENTGNRYYLLSSFKVWSKKIIIMN